MSGQYENLPFARGATYGVSDTSLETQLEGKEYIHQDKTYGTGMDVKIRVCRNNSGAVLLPKFKAKAGIP